MTSTQPETRPLRADAERNRERLIQAAAAAFAEHGLEVTVAEITHDAGVGKGTFFRNFPTKESLVMAVVRHRLSELVDAYRGLLDHPDPGEALRELMRAGLKMLAADRCLTEVPADDFYHNDALGPLYDELRELTAQIVERAQRSGALRDDVSAEDVLMLQAAVAKAVGPLLSAAPDLWRRYLDLVFEGLGPGAAGPLPTPAPSHEQIRLKFKQHPPCRSPS